MDHLLSRENDVVTRSGGLTTGQTEFGYELLACQSAPENGCGILGRSGTPCGY